MGFGQWLRDQRVANERGQISDAQYAANLEAEAKRVPDPENARYLRARARVVKSRQEAAERTERLKKR